MTLAVRQRIPYLIRFTTLGCQSMIPERNQRPCWISASAAILAVQAVNELNCATVLDAGPHYVDESVIVARTISLGIICRAPS